MMDRKPAMICQLSISWGLKWAVDILLNRYLPYYFINSIDSYGLNVLLCSLQSGVTLKHMESRDPKDDATKNEIEMLVEMELQEGMRPNRLIGSIQRAGFKVTELNRTVNPLGAAEPSDPGSIGKILILIPSFY